MKMVYNRRASFVFFDVMTLQPIKDKQIVTNHLFQVMILAISILIISSSMILFVTDRGNLISYSLEQI